MKAVRVLVVLAVLASSVLGKSSLAAGSVDVKEFRALAATADCAGSNRIRLKETLRSNLGKRGPHTSQPEGMVYALSDYETGEIKPMRLHVNVEDQDEHGNYSYNAGWQLDNGLVGQFGDISLMIGSNVTLVFTVTDLNDQLINFTDFDISFFDVDMGLEGGSNTTEAITIHPGWTALHTSSDTQLQNISNRDGSVEYRSSMFGKGGETPFDPDFLTSWQYNKAVTVHYDNFQAARVTLHAYGQDAQHDSRYFNFILQPSVLCAHEGYTTIIQPPTATTTATSTTTLAAPDLTLAPTPSDGSVFRTALAADVSAGATRIQLEDVSGAEVGMALTISDESNSETNTIVGFSATTRRLSSNNRRLGTGSVDLYSPLEFGYSAGANVTMRFLTANLNASEELVAPPVPSVVQATGASIVFAMLVVCSLSVMFAVVVSAVRRNDAAKQTGRQQKIAAPKPREVSQASSHEAHLALQRGEEAPGVMV